jgi:phospholipid/cholesterol/gamma-HCH transport system substrate-binding protein
MERQARYIVVALFLLISVGGFALFRNWVAVPEADEQTTELSVLFRGSVSGLSVGSGVRYLGVPVGRVSAIHLSQSHPGHVEVAFSTQETLPKTQMVALLESQGITGLSIIELESMSAAHPGFETGPGFIPGYPSLLTELSSSATGIADSAEQALLKLNRLMSNQNIVSLTDTIEQVNLLTNNLAQTSQNLGELVGSINRVSAELEATLPAYRAVGVKLDQELLPAVLQTATELQAATASVGAILKDNESEIAQLFEHDIPTLVGMTDELALTLRSVSELVSGLKNEPSQLIYGARVPELEIDLDE